MKVEAFLLQFLIFNSDAVLNHNPIKTGCPAVVNPMENFVPEWVTGSWFEIQRLEIGINHMKSY